MASEKKPHSQELIRAANKVLANARAKGFSRLPYMMDAVYALIPHPCHLPPDANGMAVNKQGVLFYDPDVIVNEWDLDDVMTGLFHEAEHILRKHLDRREERAVEAQDQPFWLHAVDCELNDDLQAMGLKLLKTDPLPATYQLPNGKVAEWYFDELRKKAKKQQPPGPGRGCCGSGAGVPLSNEAELGAPEIEVTQREVQLEAMRESVAAQIMAHGSVPAGLKRWAAELKQSKVKKIDWRKQLAVTASHAVQWARGHSHNTYSVINRRQAGLGFGLGAPVIAGHHRPIADVALVQDTSGSMSGEAMRSTIDQAKDILEAAGGRVTFISIDTIVQVQRRITNASQIFQHLKGGGGTDFRPAFEALRKTKPLPRVIVFATDAWGTYPELANARWCKTIWLLCTKLETLPAAYRPPFGTIIEVD